MLGRTVPSEEIGEHLENVVSSSLSTDLDRQTLPRVLVEHGQKLQRTAVMGPRAYQVVGPHVILVQWPEPDARAIVEPQPTPFRLPSGHFQPLLPPDTLHTLVVHLPALDTQQVRDLAIPVPAEPARQPYHVRCVAPPRRQVASSPGAASSAADPVRDTRDVHSPRVADVHASRTCVGARGSEVSLGRFLQDQLVHRQVRHRSL